MKNTSKLSEELGIYKILDSSSDEEKDKENNETTNTIATSTTE